MKSIKELFAEKMSLPKDVVLDLPRVSICGDKEIFIENHKGIMEYTSSCIRIKTNDGITHIYGEDMKIIILETDRMVINGEFLRVEYEKIGRKLKNVQKNL
ncbi:MAG: sporulation protein YqfC [Clostridia bacterium]|nr:sporulation protein YqfC [Clostridia bacterium]